jgi:hypothetical protein
MLQGRQNFVVERLFRAVEASEGELLALLDDEERKFIEFQMLLGIFDEFCRLGNERRTFFDYFSFFYMTNLFKSI